MTPCLANEFPSDLQMKTQNVTENSRQAYYSEILNIQGKANIIFKNLIKQKTKTIQINLLWN